MMEIFSIGHTTIVARRHDKEDIYCLIHCKPLRYISCLVLYIHNPHPINIYLRQFDGGASFHYPVRIMNGKTKIPSIKYINEGRYVFPTISLIQIVEFYLLMQ